MSHTRTKCNCEKGKTVRSNICDCEICVRCEKVIHTCSQCKLRSIKRKTCLECGNYYNTIDDEEGFCSDKCWKDHVGVSNCDCGNCIECGEIILYCGCLGVCDCE